MSKSDFMRASQYKRGSGPMTSEEMLAADREMLLFMYSTPIGHAYIRTAIMAAMMRVSLAHAWNTHGKALLARLEDEFDKKKGEVAQ